MTADRLRRMAGNTILLVAVTTTFAPLVWMITTSLKPPSEVFSDALIPIPLSPTLANYQRVLDSADIPRQLLSSVIFAGGVTIGQVAIAVPAAYALSQSSARWARWLLLAWILTLSVPFMVVYLPNYMLLADLDLLNTYPGMILPQIASAYGIFLLRQHFRAFPRSIIDAAKVDGGSEWTVLVRIVIPASRTVIVALAVFVFITTWNEYVWPLLVASDPSMQILSVGVIQFASDEGGTQWGPMMAAATIACVPTLLAFIFLRRQILRVLMEGAVKG